MSNYQPYMAQAPNQFNPYQQIQQMFPQPQGSVYSIGQLAEIGNVPIGSTGLSVAICFSESVMYIKSFQNGSPIIMAYRIAPFTKEEPSNASTSEAGVAATPIEERLGRLESLLNSLVTEKTGGEKFNGLL